MARKKTINVTISRKKNKKSVWFYVFAVLFYPITLMILLWKSKRISLKTKKTITAIAGGFIVLLPIFALLTGEPTQKTDAINRSLPATTTVTEETIDIEKELAILFDITTADTLADTTASETTITDITTISEITTVTESPSPVTTRVITTRQIEYILNKNTNVWHFPTCSHAKRIKDENKEYTTDRSYLEANCDPCGHCVY